MIDPIGWTLKSTHAGARSDLIAGLEVVRKRDAPSLGLCLTQSFELFSSLKNQLVLVVHRGLVFSE